MARRPLADRLAAERTRIAQAQERVRALEAQERKSGRAMDTRRKVLLGTLVIDELAADGPFAAELGRWLRQRLPHTLTRDTDRALMAQYLGEDAPADDAKRALPVPPTASTAGEDPAG